MDLDMFINARLRPFHDDETRSNLIAGAVKGGVNLAPQVAVPQRHVGS